MNLPQKEWAEKIAQDQDAVILDVRTPEECEEGIIPNALQINIFEGQEFVYKVGQLDKSKNYYVYCKAGSRSAQACRIMQELEFNTLYNLEDGFMNWQGEITYPK